MNKRCSRCEKIVYPIEELKCLDKIWHKGCFKCQECGMTLSMKTYKGFNKFPYCEAHIPKAKATTVAQTLETKRLAENTKIQSNVVYHADFEKNKAKFTQVADDPETMRIKANTKIISNASYHGDLEKKAIMERMREDSNVDDQKGLAASHDEPRLQQTIHHQSHPQQQPHYQQTPIMNVQQQQHYQARGTSLPQSAAGMQIHNQPNINPYHNMPSQQMPPQTKHPQQQYYQQQPQQSPQQQHSQYYPNNKSAPNNAPSSNYYPAQPGNQTTYAYTQGNVTHTQNTYQDANHNSNAGTPYSARNSQTLIYSSQTGTVPHQSNTKRVGSIADYDPVNEQYGSISQPGRQNVHPIGGYRHEQTYQVQRSSLYPEASSVPSTQGQPLQHKVNAPPTHLGRCYRAMYDYEAADTDEVSFREDDVIINCTKIDDGWMTGTVQRSGKMGMLPANYVCSYTA